MGDPVTADLEAGARVRHQGSEEHVNFDKVRPFIGFAEIFALGGDVSKSLIFQIIREIDATFELWGRVPTTLGILRRAGYHQKAKATSWYPRLWNNLLTLALKANRPSEGAIVGGGCRLSLIHI